MRDIVGLYLNPPDHAVVLCVEEKPQVQASSLKRPFDAARSPTSGKLVNKIDLFVHNYNAKATPFMWTATAESILAKVQRLCSYISGTQH